MTLAGPGGIGKTTLAVEVAAANRRAIRVTARTSSISRRSAMSGWFPAALVAALGVDVEPDDDVMERLRTALADRSILLRHRQLRAPLPGIAELVGGLLGSNPGVRVVATSREPLNVAGERVWPVDPLDVPPAEQLVRRDPDLCVRRPVHLPPADERGDPVVECRRRRRCRDDLSQSWRAWPLALELAAARTRTLSLPDLADRLGHSISELALPGHGESAPSPHVAGCPRLGLSTCCRRPARRRSER